MILRYWLLECWNPGTGQGFGEGCQRIGKRINECAHSKKAFEPQSAHDLPRKEDGATRLARALLTADEIKFLVGLAVNPAQTTDTGVPLRRIVIEDLMNDLRARGRIVSVEYF
jgi:hypothetical protein